jgi:hypothetical protein
MYTRFFIDFESFVGQLYQEDGFVDFTHAFSVFLLNVTAYLYFLKFFKSSVLFKMTMVTYD